MKPYTILLDVRLVGGNGSGSQRKRAIQEKRRGLAKEEKEIQEKRREEPDYRFTFWDGRNRKKKVILKMSNLTKLEFVVLDISGKNDLFWILDAQIHLDAMGLGNTIKEENDASLQDKANAMIFLRRHISEELNIEYLTERDSLCL